MHCLKAVLFQNALYLHTGLIDYFEYIQGNLFTCDGLHAAPLLSCLLYQVVRCDLLTTTGKL